MNAKRRAVTRMGLVAFAASSALMLGACGGGGNEAPAQGQQGAPAQSQGAPGQSQGAPNGATNVNSCVTSDKVASNPQNFAGKPVTITGTVAQVVNQHAFTVTPTGSNNSGNNTQMMLAVSKDTMQITPGSPVQVEGILQPTFDPNQAATGGNLGQGNFAAYSGKPYVQAGFAGPISSNLTRQNSSGILQNGNCAALSDVLSNMQSYNGQQITVTGTVAQVLGPHAIAVTPTGNNSGNNNGNNAQTLLAVAKDTGTLTTGSPVELTGALQPTFDMNQATAFTGSNLDQAAMGAYNGKPYMQAAYVGPVSANLASNQNGS